MKLYRRKWNNIIVCIWKYNINIKINDKTHSESSNTDKQLINTTEDQKTEIFVKPSLSKWFKQSIVW